VHDLADDALNLAAAPGFNARRAAGVAQWESRSFANYGEVSISLTCSTQPRGESGPMIDAKDVRVAVCYGTKVGVRTYRPERDRRYPALGRSIILGSDQLHAHDGRIQGGRKVCVAF
jgi:hypothetical protein